MTDPCPDDAENRRDIVSLEGMSGSPGHLIRRAHQHATAVFGAVVEGHNLTPVQFAALVVIANEPETDAAHVSELISFDRTTVGQVLSRLERKGFITRAKLPSDGRRRVLNLTNRGRAVLEDVSGLIPAVERDILHPLTRKERTLLCGLLRKIAVPRA